MQPTEKQFSRLRTHLSDALVKADATHDIETRLKLIIESTEQAITYLKYLNIPQDCELDIIQLSDAMQLPKELHLPDDIHQLLQRLEGRAYSPRAFDSSEHHLLMHTACALIHQLSPGQTCNHTPSKEDELIDELVQLIIPAAKASYVSKMNSQILACFFSIDKDDLKAKLISVHTAIKSKQSIYTLKTTDRDITQLYHALLDQINAYAITQDIDELTTNCTLILERPRYDHLLNAFSQKLHELKAYVAAEPSFKPPKPDLLLLAKGSTSIGCA
jgi:hypothetical protein